MKTSPQQTSQSGEDESTFSLEDFRVNPSAMPGSEAARTMTATSGRTCSAALTRSDPLGLLLKMLLESSRWSSRARYLRWQARQLFSTKVTTFDDTNYEKPLPFNESATTLKVTDIPSSRCLFQLAVSEPPHRRDRVFIIGHRIASDTSGDGVLREAREYEGESREERLQERNKVQRADESSHVRPESERTMADTCDAGLENTRAEQPTAGTTRSSSQNVEGWDIANTEGECGERLRPGEREVGQSKQVELGGSGGEDAPRDEEEIRWHATDPNFYRVERDIRPRIGEQSQSGFSAEEFADGYRHLRSELRWLDFPTVPPVHRRNDGLPLLVDDLTISFGKWRTEALKAYGNAIVPQVMYEIFSSIEQVEKQLAIWQRNRHTST